MWRPNLVLCTWLLVATVTGHGAMAQVPNAKTDPDIKITRSGNFMVQDHIVIDLTHNIEWMRCSVGQIWSGAVCTGDAMPLNHDERLLLHKNSWARGGGCQAGRSWNIWYVIFVRRLK